MVTPESRQDRAQVADLAAQVQSVTGQRGAVAFVDQGSTGEEPEAAAAEQGIRLEVVKLPQARQGVVRVPRRSRRGAQVRVDRALPTPGAGL